MSSTTLDDPYLAEARGIVVETVKFHLARGMQVQEALAAAVRDLPLSARRIRSYWHNEVTTVAAREWAALKAKREAVLRAQLRKLDAEYALIRARLEECKAL